PRRDRRHHIAADGDEIFFAQRLCRSELVHIHRAPPRHASIHTRSFARALLTCTRTVAGELPRIAATSSVDSSSTSRRITASRSFGGSESMARAKSIRNAFGGGAVCSSRPKNVRLRRRRSRSRQTLTAIR